MEGLWWVSLCVCMYVHVQVCHFGSVLTMSVPGVRGSLSVRVSECVWVSECERVWVSVSVSECECEWVGEWVSECVCEREKVSEWWARVRTLSHTCHAKATSNAHCPTPWQCTLPHACHAKAAETQGRQRDARVYIRPLGSAHCPTPATQKRRRPRDARGTPGRTSEPLAVHIVPRLPRKRGGDPLTPEGRQGVHPTPWQRTLSHACHAKRRSPKGRQGAHPTPWQCTLPHACHAKEAETQGHQRDARAYIRPLGRAPTTAPATQKRRRSRDATRAYIRPLGRAPSGAPDGRRRKADTELKTKTPHVNVGKNTY